MRKSSLHLCAHTCPQYQVFTHTHTCSKARMCTHTCACTHWVPQPALGLSPKGRFQPDGQLLEKCEIPGGDAWRLPHRWEGLCRGRGDPTWALSCLLSPTLAQELRSPSGAEVPYCDLPRCPPAPEDPLSASTSGCRSVVDLGLRPGSRRWVESQGLGKGFMGGNALALPICTPSPRQHLSVMAAGMGHVVSPLNLGTGGQWACFLGRQEELRSHHPACTWVAESPLPNPGCLSRGPCPPDNLPRPSSALPQGVCRCAPTLQWAWSQPTHISWFPLHSFKRLNSPCTQGHLLSPTYLGVHCSGLWGSFHPQA